MGILWWREKRHVSLTENSSPRIKVKGWGLAPDRSKVARAVIDVRVDSCGTGTRSRTGLGLEVELEIGIFRNN